MNYRQTTLYSVGVTFAIYTNDPDTSSLSVRMMTVRHMLVCAGFERSLHEAHQLFGWGHISSGRDPGLVGQPDVERPGQFEKRHGSAANGTEGRAGMGSDPGRAYPAAWCRERQAYAIGQRDRVYPGGLGHL